MADLTSVGVTSGVPSSGTGTVGTINYLTQVGSPISNGSTSAPVTVAITGTASAVTSTMSALVTTLSPNSSVRTVTLSSNPTVIPSSAVQVTLTSNVVALSSNPTVILSSAPSFSFSSGLVTITDGTNNAVVAGNASAPTSSMSALVVSLSPNSINANGQQAMTGSAPVVIASNQSYIPVILTSTGTSTVTLASNSVVTLASSGGTNANVIAGSSAVTSTMAALVVALSTLGATGGTSTVQISSGTVTLSSALTPKNYLWNAGTGNNGILNNTTVTLISSEMTSLASSGTVTSAAGGAGGLFTSSNTGQAVWAELFVTGNTTATTVAGANISGWFLTSPNAGTTIESTVLAVIPRPADFVVPLPVGTLGSSTTYKAAGLVRVPALNFKLNVQNNAGIVWGSSTSGLTSVTLVPIAESF